MCEAAEYGRYCAYHQLGCEFESSSWQHYLKNFVSDLRQMGGFFSSTPVTSTNATARHDMIEIASGVKYYNPNTKSLPWCDAVEYGRSWVRLSVGSKEKQ